MIPLKLPASIEASEPYVARLRGSPAISGDKSDAVLVETSEESSLFAGPHGLLQISGVGADALEGDVVLVDPAGGSVERLIRAASSHNTFLVTERCDQLCVMCSQPPKKTHVDRFGAYLEAAHLAPQGTVIGISGGEPTLYKEDLLGLIENVLDARPDLAFHVLTNGQHFTGEDVERLRTPFYRQVQWGIPLYSADPRQHDTIVDKAGAFERLQESLTHLMLAGANVELRTVVLSSNLEALPELARYVASRLRFIDAWSIMQLENIGFARNRWQHLYVEHRDRFGPIASALDNAILYGVSARLFNFARCTVPPEYRELAEASISDWKRRYAPACDGCSQKDRCCGFFEWHPDSNLAGVRPL